MGKKTLIYKNDEIDIGEIFIILWNLKIKIALIALISFVIIIGYDNSKPEEPNVFKNTLTIKSAKENEFFILESLQNEIVNVNKFKKDTLRENLTDVTNYNVKVLHRFIEELLDYQELLSVLKKNENIKKISLNYLNMISNKSCMDIQNCLLSKSHHQKLKIMNIL